ILQQPVKSKLTCTSADNSASAPSQNKTPRGTHYAYNPKHIHARNLPCERNTTQKQQVSQQLSCVGSPTRDATVRYQAAATSHNP
ncbi:hypothetical protein CCMA1212_007198, partial [Trichoderma ghanense]